MKHRSTAFSPAAAAARRVQVEPLESRMLFATTPLPTGFVESVYLQDPDNLDQLTSMTFAPDGRLFVLEKKGNVRVVKSGQVNPTPFFSVEVDGFSERGLDGIELDPNFASNGYVYLYYTAPDPQNPNTAPNAAKNRLVRVTADPANPDVALANSMVVLLDGIASDTGYHNGGSLHFGSDGMLYLGTGESGVRQYAGDLSTLNGKVLRLDVDHLTSADSVIPADNPFVNTPGARPEIYAYGFRNPFSSAVDPATGKFFVNDVGGSLIEEIDDVTAPGGNYGWPQAEGASAIPGLINPIYQYAHLTNNTEGTIDSSITGGVFYHGAAFPQEQRFPAQYEGDYFFGDYSRHFIRVLDPATKQVSTFVEPTFRDIIDLDIGPDGALYALGYQWRILQYSFQQTPPPSLAVSLTADTQAGAAPLSVAFNATVTGAADPASLQYLWLFDETPNADPGLTAGPAISHIYPQAGSYRAMVTVFGGTVAVSAEIDVNVSPGSNTPPKLKVKASKNYFAGSTITFSASAKDRQDGVLNASSFKYDVIFHHESHTHPYIPITKGASAGSFSIPDVLAENDPIQWYEIRFTATDSGGLKTSSSVEVHPKIGKFTLSNNVPGLSLILDDVAVTLPLVTKAVVQSGHTVAAPAMQQLNGIGYQFVKWSDGGEATHVYQAPNGRKKLVATYVAVAPVDVSLTRVDDAIPITLTPGNIGPALRVAVANSGAVNLNGGAELVLVASLDDVADAGDVDLAVAEVALRLRVDQSRTFKLRIDPPVSLPAGSYHLLAVLRNISNIPDENPFDDSLVVSDLLTVLAP